jgi:outer membrane protein OmpA-like peptidoglycan-associated protein
MKTRFPILFAVALISHASAQSPTPPVVVVEEKTVVVPVQPAAVVSGTVVSETVVPGAPSLVRMDPALARRQLGTMPKAIDVPAHPPGTTVETTETTTTRNIPGQPPRVYNVERSTVIVEGRELPYIIIPVLFVKETAELLDSESRVALDDTASAIREIIKSDPTAVFDIEGHTSSDGTVELNLDLSAQRARRVFEELTKRYQIPVTVLSAHGYGESYPSYPAGTEAQMTLDRRVLVVRVK